MKQMYKISFFLFVFFGFTISTIAQTVYNYTGTVQTYVVPAGVTNIQIEAIGAEGGAGTTASTGIAGKGTGIQGNFAVTPGQVLNIMVGEQGESADHVGGGGGGSFVWDDATSTLLIAAGGGGGGGKTDLSDFTNVDGIDASITEDGTNGAGMTDGAGTAGNGGTVPTCINWASGGAGWNSNGANGSLHGCATNSTGGDTPLSGGAGGIGGGGASAAADGGYGGGGGGNARCGAIGGGGGGGYSGGGAGGEIGSTGNYNGGGGGGSYNSGADQVNTAGAGIGNGQVTITELCDNLVTTVSSDTVCDGEEVILHAESTNAGTISWSGGITDSVAFTPSVGTTTYTATSTDADDCEFSVDIFVGEYPTVDAGTDTSICEGDSVMLAGTGTANVWNWSDGVVDGDWFTPPSGTTTYTVTGEIDSTGCSAVDSVDVTYNVIDPTVSVSGIELTANQAGATYQWIDCSDSSNVSGATSQSFTPEQDGDYAVIIDLNGCIDTSACETISGVGIVDFGPTAEFAIYPNPTTANLTVQAKNNFTFIIYDASGKTVMIGEGSVKEVLNVSELEKGAYMISIRTETDQYNARFVKK